MADGQTSTLDDMCELIVDCPHFTPEWTESGFVVVRNQNVRDGKLDLSQPSFTHRQDFERRIKRARPTAGDIIFTREAPMGEVCMIPEGLECCLGQRQVLLRPKSSINGRYLFFALRSAPVRHQIFWSEGTGSTVSNVRIPSLKALKIPRLGTGEEAIGELLGALDDKIDLNRRMNETLEEMARALFKDWFVDFGPTKVKMEGRAPYLEADLWALFPGRLDEEGKPEGWSAKTLASFCTVSSGKRPTVKTPSPDPSHQVPVYGGNGVSWYTSQPLFAPPFVITGRVGTLGTVFRVYESVWVSDNALCFFPRQAEYLEFVFFSIGRLDFTALNSGSTQPLITQTAMKRQVVIDPGDSILRSFSGVIRPLFQRIEANASESYDLAQTRDLILPKLMSGEIRVAEAEQLVAEAL